MQLRDFNVTRWVMPYTDDCKTQGVDAIVGLGKIERPEIIEMANLMTSRQFGTRAVLN